MNEYDEKYEIRLANERDIDSIMEFIGEHWKKNHIMSINRSFFEYEFLEDDGTVNFILAIDKEKGTIEALNGVLKASHDDEHTDVFGSFWKSLEGNMAFLGLELIKRKSELYNVRAAIGVGDNPKTSIPLMKLLHRYTARMKHYYMLSDIENFQIAKIEYVPDKMQLYDNDYNVIEYKTVDSLLESFRPENYIDHIPYKDTWYINHRFFSHPIYHYNVYGIEKKGNADAIFVTREEKYNDRIAVRIVDFIGKQEAILGMGLFLKKLLLTPHVEYIDFYCYGLDNLYMEQIGFTEVKENDVNVIPNYFHPFVRENIDIFVSSSMPNTVFTKADADQDRPN